jgi:hypothetical protein
VRTVSLVLYPSQHQSFAKILAARLGFRANVYRGEAIVVLLGRDAARPIAGQLGG